MQMQLEIILEQKKFLSEEVSFVSLPTLSGEIGILPGHISLITEIDSGILSYYQNNKKNNLVIHYGYAQIKNDKITVLVHMLESINTIDINRAKKSKQSVEEALRNGLFNLSEDKNNEYLNKLESKLLRALTRIKAKNLFY